MVFCYGEFEYYFGEDDCLDEFIADRTVLKVVSESDEECVIEASDLPRWAVLNEGVIETRDLKLRKDMLATLRAARNDNRVSEECYDEMVELLLG